MAVASDYVKKLFLYWIITLWTKNRSDQVDKYEND